LELPAKYSHTIYKFHIPKPFSEQQFLRSKSIEKIEYLQNVKCRIKKEKRVFIRHHWLSLITFWISIILAISSIILFLISLFLKFNPTLGENHLKTIIIICLVISVLTLIVLQIRHFPTSFLSFQRYVKEKYNYYIELKDTIDSCEEYYNYKKQYFR
jgi:amino acid transporter